MSNEWRILRPFSMARKQGLVSMGPQGHTPGRSDPVSQAFKNDLDYAPEFMKDLRENWRDANVSLSRVVLLSVLLSVIFEFFVRASIGKVSFGPFEIKDLSLIRKVIPVILAYYFYELQLLYSLKASIEEIYVALMKKMHAGVIDSGLLFVLQPRLATLFAPWAANLSNEVAAGRLYNRLGMSLSVLTLFGIPLFEIYAFTVQFRSFGLDDALVWISLALVFYFVTLGSLVAGAKMARDHGL